MLRAFFRRLDARNRLRASPFAALIEAYATYLCDRGFARQTIRERICGVEHFETWLSTKQLSLDMANEKLVHAFLHDHLPKCRCPAPSSVCFGPLRPALKHLLKLLRQRGQRHDKPNAIESTLEQYVVYLRNTGGLSDNTCLCYLRYLRRFLQGKFGRRALRWNTLRASDVISFVTRYARDGKRVSAQGAAGSLRSFLRYLQTQGLCGSSLIAAVPIIRDCRLARIPKTMTEKQRRDFLSAFDRSTATGRRNYAMALCQLDLGLRVSEVVGLRFDHIDWRKATVHIEAAKTGRARELPLPDRVGRAISQYLRDGRPPTSDRHVFLRHRWRHGIPVDLDVIRKVIADTFAKVKGCEHLRGTHVLRHTAATRMLRNGASLKKIADVLGHRSMNTTVIYAKVDLGTLAAVALPWPEVQP